MNTITLPREIVEQALAALEYLGDQSDCDVDPFRWSQAKAGDARDNLRAALQQSEPQAQAGHLHLKPPFEDENGNDISGEYIPLQAHREALQDQTIGYEKTIDNLQDAIAKKDAALKACVSARDRLAQEPTVLIQKWKVLEELNAAITQAQGAMK